MDDAEVRLRWSKTIPDTADGHLDAGATYRPRASSGKTVPLAPPATAPERPPAAAVVSARPSSYELAGVLGRGGMGVVHRATQSGLERLVAVKTIGPGSDSEEARRRFASEARVTALVEHPNVVPVHELLAIEGGDLALSMKLVGGVPWSRLLHPTTPDDRARGRELDARDRAGHLEILRSVCQAVAFAHSKGIVHRDLKPDNVMVGEFGEVLVMDWGLAAEIGEPRGIAEPAAATDGPLGTPSYMAPELADGRGADTGSWTDVYLLGAILHEILTGAPPHRGASFWKVVAAASLAEPPVLGTDVPEELRRICRRALAREPRERFASARELRDALETFLRHRESSRIASAAERSLETARATGTGDRSTLYARYAESVAGFKQALVLWEGNLEARVGEANARAAFGDAALGGGDVNLARAQAAALPEDDERRRKLEGRIEAELARRTKQVRSVAILRGALAFLGAVVVVGTVAFVAHLERSNARERAARQDAEALVETICADVQPVLEGLGRVDVMEKVTAEIKAHYDRVGPVAFLELARDGAPRRRIAIARQEGETLLQNGNAKGAVERFEHCLALARESGRRDDECTAHADLADALAVASDPERARREVDAALAIARPLAGTGERFWRSLLATCLTTSANLKASAANPGEALADIREAVAIQEAIFTREGAVEEQLALFEGLEREGVIEWQAGDPAVEATYRKVVALGERVLPRNPKDPAFRSKLGKSLSSLGFLERGAGELEPALAHSDRAVELCRALAAEAPEDREATLTLATVLGHRSMTHEARGERQAALDDLVAARHALAELEARRPAPELHEALERVDSDRKRLEGAR